METQFLPFDYGSKKKLEEKLDKYLGNGNYQVVERTSNQWKIMVTQKLNPTQVEDIRGYLRQRHYSSTT